MKNQNWKLKYQDLKLKFLDSVDLSFRLGYEQGAQGAQLQQAAQDKQNAAAQQAAASGIQPGQDPNEQPGEEAGMDAQQPSDGSELDQHIGQLESMLQKSDYSFEDKNSIKKSLDGIKAFKSSLKLASDLKKSEKAIKEIGKALKSPYTLSKSATKNMSEHGKKALNEQEKIVVDLMKSFEEEEKKAAEAISKTLSIEQLLKG